MLHTATPLAVLAVLATLSPYSSASPVANPDPEPAAHHDATNAAQPSNTKRCGCGGIGCGVCGGYGGYSGWGWGRGFPFVSAFNSNFDRASNRASFNENTVFANNINANQANDAVHANTNAFNSFRKRCGCGTIGCGICGGYGGYGYPYYGGYGWGGYGGYGWPGCWY